MDLIIVSIISSTVTRLTAVILIESRRERTFRVRCISFGGGGQNMSINGASNTNIRLVIDSQGLGQDVYYTTTDIISGGSDRDTYQCTASNGVSSKKDSIQLRGD